MLTYNHDSVGLGDAARVAFTQTGAGADVVLIHGALATREDMLLSLCPALAPEFRVTAVDRPGHGGSTRSGWTGSPWRQAAAVHEASERLGLRRPVIVGHSHGGAVALAYALQFPADVAGVVALAPITFPELRLEHVLFGPRGAWPAGPVLNQVVSSTSDPVLLPLLWRAMFLPQAMPARYAAVFPFAEAGNSAHMEAEGEDAILLNLGLARSAMMYGACSVPVRIFGGDRDLVVNNALHGRLAASLIPDGHYASLPGLGHMLHHFAQEPIVEAVRGLA
ncbi:alpha/beta hydrolase [Phenylobacterium sp.]|jgi:pimeloyl-ACP methyl ester carboxylesterase|uniref:alpha/beta hydrolase n=1 Tax=Phenylobacterium sp. TaxID=1871053 RepID=UPI002F94DC09